MSPDSVLTDWLELLDQIRELFTPDQIFSENDLRQWAVENDYALTQEPNEAAVRY